MSTIDAGDPSSPVLELGVHGAGSTLHWTARGTWSRHGRIQAVILAAGSGSRLRRPGVARPKCLEDAGGASLLERQLHALRAAGIREIAVVTGYLAEQVREAAGPGVELIHNARFAATNSLYSLWLCRDWVTSSLLVMNCDVLFHPEILRQTLAAPGSAFAYDSSSGSDAEHMKVVFSGRLLDGMSKRLPREITQGENVGLLHFEARAARILFRQAEAEIRAGGGNSWMAAAVERVARIVPLHGVDVAGLPWIEIDYPDDLRRAQSEVWPAIAGARGPLHPPFVASSSSPRSRSVAAAA